MTGGVALIRADNVVLNVAMISAFHQDEDGKIFCHYAGGRIWSFSGEQGRAIWAVLVQSSKDVMPAAVGSAD